MNRYIVTVVNDNTDDVYGAAEYFDTYYLTSESEAEVLDFIMRNLDTIGPYKDVTEERSGAYDERYTHIILANFYVWGIIIKKLDEVDWL